MQQHDLLHDLARRLLLVENQLEGFRALHRKTLLLQGELRALREELLPANEVTLRRKATSHVDLGSVVDAGIMFSDPLVQVLSNGQERTEPEPVSYGEEIRRLSQIFKNAEVPFRVLPASIHNLERVVSRSPQILHIICHGKQSRGEHSLSFESYQYIGELKELGTQYFRHHARGWRNLKLVFVNACYSEACARAILEESEIPLAIAVESQEKIEDEAAVMFSASFYDNLLQRKSIQEAFAKALFLTCQERRKEQIACCCSHSHLEGCLFMAAVQEQGLRDSHLLHAPGKGACKCGQSWRNVHGVRCRFAIQFLRKYNQLYLNWGEEDFASFNQLHVCCCMSIQQYRAHDQSMKFKLLFNSKVPPREVFLEVSQVREYDDQGLYWAHWLRGERRLVGRNLEIARIARLLKGKIGKRDCKAGLVVGVPGSGRTSVMRKGALYVIQRGLFPEGIVELQLNEAGSLSSFLFKLCEPFANFQLKEVIQFYHKRSVVFILDNADKLILDIKGEFLALLRHLCAQLHNCKFLLSVEAGTLARLCAERSADESWRQLRLGEFPVELKPLSKDSAARILLSCVGESIEKKYHNPAVLREHKLFGLIDLQPKLIIDLAQNFETARNRSKRLLSLDQYASQLEAKSKQENNCQLQRDAIFHQNLSSIASQPLYDFLQLLAWFPEGLSPCQFQALFSLEPLLFDEGWQHYFQELQSHSAAIGGGVNYFVEVVTREKSTCCKVNRFIRQYFQEKDPDRYMSKEPVVLNFLAALSETVILRAKARFLYHEKMIEFSSLSESGLWAIRAKPLRSSPPFERVIEERGEAQLERLFTEFIEIILALSLNTLAKNCDYFIENWSAIESIALNVPSLCKLFQRNQLAGDLALRFVRELEEASLKHRKALGTLNLRVKQAQMKLLLLNVNVQLSTNKSKELGKVTQLFREAKTFLEGFDLQSALPRYFDCETGFVKAFLSYKALKEDKLNSNFSLKHLQIQLKSLREILQPVIQSGQSPSFSLLVCKLTILQAKVCRLARRLRLSCSSRVSEEQLAQVLSTAKAMDLKSLELKSLFQLLTLSKEVNEFGLEEVEAVRVARVEPIKQLLESCQYRLMNKKLQNKLRAIETVLQDKANQGLNSLVVFMRANSFSDKLRLRKDFGFKNKMLEVLSESKREVTVRFDLLTSKNLQATMAAGCKLMVLYFEGQAVSQCMLQLEREDLPENELYDIAELAKFSSQSLSHSILLVVGRGLAASKQTLLKYFPFEVIAIFELAPQEQFSWRILQHQAAPHLCLYFLRLVFQDMTVTEALAMSTRETILHAISQSGGLLSTESEFEERIGRPAVLRGGDSCMSLKQGQFRLVLSPKPNHNIMPSSQVFVGRGEQVGQLCRLLREPGGQRVNLFGGEGVGRTAFGEELAYYLWSQNAFEDGVFMVRCGEYEGDIRTLLEGAFGFAFSQIGKKSSYRMILMFDDFEVLLQKGRNESLLEHVFSTLQRHSIHLLLITRKSLTACAKLKLLDLRKLKPVELPALSKQEALALAESKLSECDSATRPQLLARFQDQWDSWRGNIRDSLRWLEHLVQEPDSPQLIGSEWCSLKRHARYASYSIMSHTLSFFSKLG